MNGFNNYLYNRVCYGYQWRWDLEFSTYARLSLELQASCHAFMTEDFAVNPKKFYLFYRNIHLVGTGKAA